MEALIGSTCCEEVYRRCGARRVSCGEREHRPVVGMAEADPVCEGRAVGQVRYRRGRGMAPGAQEGGRLYRWALKNTIDTPAGMFYIIEQLFYK